MIIAHMAVTINDPAFVVEPRACPKDFTRNRVLIPADPNASKTGLSKAWDGLSMKLNLTALAHP